MDNIQATPEAVNNDVEVNNEVEGNEQEQQQAIPAEDNEEATNKQQNEFDMIKKSLPKGSELVVKDGKAYVTQKINGQTKTKTLDAIIRDYSKAEATDDILHDAKVKQKEAENMKASIEAGMQRLLENPEEYLKLRRKAGYKEDDDYEFAYKVLEEGVKRKEMTPEQLKLQELEKYKAEQESKEQETKKTVEQQKFDAEVEHHRADISTKCIEALKQAGITEKTDKGTRQLFLSAMLHEMAKAERYGFKPEEFTASDAIERVKSSVKKFADYYYTVIPEQEILNSLPKRVIDIIRGKKVAFDEIPTSNSLKTKSPVNYGNSSKKTEKFNFSDWDKHFKS